MFLQDIAQSLPRRAIQFNVCLRGLVAERPVQEFLLNEKGKGGIKCINCSTGEDVAATFSGGRVGRFILVKL